MRASIGQTAMSLVLIALGVILLIDNFIGISGFDRLLLLPLVLIVLGALVLVRGDVGISKGKSFGITRGSIESASLEISAGAVDVRTFPLQREGRLIAGEFAPESRPTLEAQETHASLTMRREATPFFAFSPWLVALAPDLPWSLFISTSLGQVNADLSGIISQQVVIASGFGDIHLTTPREALEPITLRSSVGTIYLTIPEGANAQIIARAGRFFGVHYPQDRYQRLESKQIITRNSADNAPLIVIYVSGTFGDLYLS